MGDVIVAQISANDLLSLCEVDAATQIRFMRRAHFLEVLRRRKGPIREKHPTYILFPVFNRTEAFDPLSFKNYSARIYNYYNFSWEANLGVGAVA